MIFIFGFGKKAAKPTFKQRVAEFWDWYPQVADRFYRTIEAGQCEGLAGEVSKFADKTLPRMSWVFGPGENGGHSFTLTGEGDVPRQLLAEYWLSRAPQIPKWTFYAARQPSPTEKLQDIAIRVSDHDQIDADSMLLQTTVDEEAKVVDLIAWHPLFEHLPEEHHFQILFLLLDEALGEFGTQTWIGDIKIEPLPEGGTTRKLIELPQFLQQVAAYHEWEKLSPLESYTLYEVPEQSNSPRGDTVVGTSCIPRVVFELLENGGKLSEDPLAETGAEFVYIAIDGDVFPSGKQSDVRGNIEDALHEALEKSLCGRTLGGAFGLNESYIDIILFDGPEGRQIIEATLEELQLRGRAEIRSFV